MFYTTWEKWQRKELMQVYVGGLKHHPLSPLSPVWGKCGKGPSPTTARGSSLAFLLCGDETARHAARQRPRNIGNLFA